MHDRERFVKFTRLNEAGAESGDIWLNDDHVVAVIGEETAPAVRVLTVAGVEVRLAQPQGPDDEGHARPSVLAQLRGTTAAAKTKG